MSLLLSLSLSPPHPSPPQVAGIMGVSVAGQGGSGDEVAEALLVSPERLDAIFFHLDADGDGAVGADDLYVL